MMDSDDTNERQRLLPSQTRSTTGNVRKASSGQLYSSRQPSQRSIHPRTGVESGTENLAADELLYRMNYAFINQGFDFEKEVEVRHSRLPLQEQEVFGDEILDNIKHNSLPLREKVKVVRMIQRKEKRRREGQPYQSTLQKRKLNYDFTFGLWEETIKNLAAYFGSNVASYFSFLRTLFFLNTAIALLLLSFSLVPHLIDRGNGPSGSVNGSFGELSDSLFFYGAYSDEGIDNYNHPLSYLLTWLAVTLLSLAFIGISMDIRYRKSKLSVSSADDYDFSRRVFCSWDHSITSRDGINQHVQAYCTELKERIREEEEQEKKNIRELVIFRTIARIFTNLFVFALLAGSGYLIYYVAQKFELPETAPDFVLDLFDRYQLTVVVAVLKLVMPVLFKLIARLEQWHPRTEQKVQLARTMVFYLASIVIFIVSLYSVTTSCLDNSVNHPDKAQFKDPSQNSSSNASTTFCCWENQVGEEIFKLILVDLAICIAVGIFFHCVKAFLVKNGQCFSWVTYSEFDVTSNVLDLVYGQGLVWLGLYFSPAIAGVAVLKLLVLFYFRFTVAKLANTPPARVFRASRSGNFYLFLLLITWFVCTLPQGYVIIEVTPSWDCGPFRQVNRVLNIITDGIGEIPEWLNDVLSTIVTATVVIPMLLLITFIALYYRVRASSYGNLARELRKQLIFERKVEKRKVFNRAISAPAGSLGRTSGSNLSTIHREATADDTSPLNLIADIHEASGETDHSTINNVGQQEDHPVVHNVGQQGDHPVVHNVGQQGDHPVVHNVGQQGDHPVVHNVGQQGDHPAVHNVGQQGDHPVVHNVGQQGDHPAVHNVGQQGDHPAVHNVGQQGDHPVVHNVGQQGDHPAVHNVGQQGDHPAVHNVGQQGDHPVVHNVGQQEEDRNVHVHHPSDSPQHHEVQPKFVVGDEDEHDVRS